MLNWWKGLKQRERNTLGLAGIISGILLIYLMIIHPFTAYKNHLVDKLQEQQALLQWIQPVGSRITRIKHQKKPLKPTLFVHILTSTLKEHKLDQYMAEIKQIQTHNFKIQLANIPFDAFIKWLSQLNQSYTLHIDELQISAHSGGHVAVQMTISC